jgi:hypothetical protein
LKAVRLDHQGNSLNSAEETGSVIAHRCELRHGRDENVKSGQEALAQRARCNGAASRGTYTEEMEAKSAGVGTPAHRREGHDD